MLLPHPLVPAAYHELVGRARGSPACTTFLLVAPDVDSLCAARLLAQLLKTDDVAHQTTPVGSWAQLHAECAQLALAQQVRSLVLVGLGAAADLYALLGSEGCQLPKDCLVHVIDAHRPIALANLFTRADYARALFDPRRIRARQAPGGIHSARLPPLPEHELSVVVWDEPRASEPRDHDGDGEGPHDPWKKEREAWEELEVRRTTLHAITGRVSLGRTRGLTWTRPPNSPIPSQIRTTRTIQTRIRTTPTAMQTRTQTRRALRGENDEGQTR